MTDYETISLATLLERNNDRIGLVEKALSLREEQFKFKKPRKLSKTLIERIDESYGARVSLIKNFSSANQVVTDDNVTKQTSPSTLVRVSRIRKYELHDCDHAKTFETIWRAIPDCKFKRFQELFCSPHRYGIPIEALQVMQKNGDKISFPGFQWENLSVSGCEPSADHISDNFAIKIGLIRDSESFKDDPTARLEAKNSLAVFRKLKKIWDDATQVAGLRILRLAGETSAAGNLLYIRESGGDKVKHPIGPTESAKLIVSLYSDIYKVLRATDQREAKHKRETDDMAELSARSGDLGDRLATYWVRGAPEQIKEKLRNDGESVAQLAEKRLGHAINPNKRKAFPRIVQGGRIVDKRNQENPPASALKLRTGGEDLDTRGSEVRAIAGYNGSDFHAAKALIKKQQTVLDLFCERFSEASNEFGQFEINSKNLKIDSVGYQKEKQKLIASLGLSDRSLSRLTVQPFSTFRTILEEAFKKLLNDLDNKTLDRLPARLNQIGLALNAYKANVEVERVRWMIQEHLDPRPKATAYRLETAQQLVAQEPMFSNVEHSRIGEIQVNLQGFLEKALVEPELHDYFTNNDFVALIGAQFA